MKPICAKKLHGGCINAYTCKGKPDTDCPNYEEVYILGAEDFKEEQTCDQED